MAERPESDETPLAVGESGERVLAGDSSQASLTLDESSRRRFETAWRTGKREPIENFLPAADHPQYLPTLEELVHIEIEFAWRDWASASGDAALASAWPAGIEAYLTRFPRLNQAEVIARLVQQEFRVRQRHGNCPDPQEFHQRFPGVVIPALDLPTGPRAFLAPAQQAGEIGRLGPYRVRKVLGAGGMGIVFQAEDPDLRRLVALKVMKPELASNTGARQRFRREAQAAAAITHDHIVTTFDVGEDRGVPYFAMALLEGESLEDRLKREGPLPIGDVVRIGREIAAGLEAAHERGLIHRDIKPANVWLEMRASGEKTEEGQVALGQTTTPARVKIMDFGLARPSDADSQLTQAGAILGTPAYMSPEQARGETVDARADLFSLGCVLYRMSTGRFPFKGKDAMATLLAIANDNPPAPHEVNPEAPIVLSELILDLLTKSAADRPASAAEVVEALRQLEDFQPDQTSILSRRTRKPRAPAKLPVWRRMPAIVGGVVCLAALVAAAFFLLRPSSGTLTDPDTGLGEGVLPSPPLLVKEALPDPPRWALEFDGVKSSVVLPPFTFDAAKGLTMEVFVNFAKTNRFQHVLVTDDGKAGLTWMLQENGYLGAGSLGDIVPGKHTGAEALAAGVIPPGIWTHFAVVMQGRSIRFFVNGQAASLRGLDKALLPGGYNLPPALSPRPASTSVFVGGAGAMLEGRLFELRLSNVPRYTTDFKPQARLQPDSDTFALYHFDEGGGDVLKDSSGHGRHGKIVAAKWLKVAAKDILPPAVVRYASRWGLEFDGKTSQVVIPTLSRHARPLTVETWVSPRDPARESEVFVLGGDGGQVSLRQRRNTWLFLDCGLGMELTTPPLAPQGIFHLAYSSDGGEGRMYVNGRLAARGNRPNNPSGGTTAGAWFGPPVRSRFSGVLHETRISTVARYRSDFTPERRFERDQATLALYHFDEAAGAILKDSSGNGHHGQIARAKWVKAVEVSNQRIKGVASASGEWRDRPLGKDAPGKGIPLANRWVLDFDGKNCYALLPPFLFDAKKGFTLETFINLGSVRTHQVFLDSAAGDGGVSLFLWNIGNLGLAALPPKAGEGRTWYGTGADIDVANGTWMHFAAVVRENGVRFFINGKKTGVREHPGPGAGRFPEVRLLPGIPKPAAAPVFLGCSRGPHLAFEGKLCELRLSTVARYMKDFVPATHSQADADTYALYHFDEGLGDRLLDSSGHGRHGKIHSPRWVKADLPD